MSPIPRLPSALILAALNADLSAALQVAVAWIAEWGIVAAVALVGVGTWLAGGRTVRGALVAVAPGLLAAGIAIVAVALLGTLLPTDRPFVVAGQAGLIAHAPDSSFPSHHATVGMSMLGARIDDRRLQVAVGAVVMLVGLARVLADVHWLADVLGGALIGLACAWTGRAAWSVAWRRWTAPV
jgi:undecaprenyl-diphosphatase